MNVQDCNAPRIFDFHPKYITIKSSSNNAIHGSIHTILVHSVLNDQGIRDIRIKDYVVSGHNQDSTNNTLKKEEKKVENIFKSITNAIFI